MESECQATVLLSAELGDTRPRQLFVSRESDGVRVIRQEGAEPFTFPDLPEFRILLGWPRPFDSAPEALPGLATLIDPHGGIGAAASTLDSFDEVVCDESREPQEVPCLGIAEKSLKLLGRDLRSEFIFMNTDDATHARNSPVTPAEGSSSRVAPERR
jgi:hypothetical protein